MVEHTIVALISQARGNNILIIEYDFVYCISIKMHDDCNMARMCKVAINDPSHPSDPPRARISVGRQRDRERRGQCRMRMRVQWPLFGEPMPSPRVRVCGNGRCSLVFGGGGGRFDAREIGRVGKERRGTRGQGD